MKKVRQKSVLPVYGLAAVWLLYCLFFPLLRLTDYLLLIGCSAAVFIILSRLFPGKTIMVTEPEKPHTTGNPAVDRLLHEGRLAVSEMSRLRTSIQNEVVCGKIASLIDVTEKIFKSLEDDVNDLTQVRRFAAYYLPTTLKLLNAYDRLGDLGDVGDNITGTRHRIEAILDTTLDGYKKQLDALYANQALDIETDITVLENMLKREGLSGKDF
ncbi:5-bromo-4-chloroindolyl phosphate hydrolysis family protein [Oscillospiraceae bacterium WX1]